VEPETANEPRPSSEGPTLDLSPERKRIWFRLTELVDEADPRHTWKLGSHPRDEAILLRHLYYFAARCRVIPFKGKLSSDEDIRRRFEAHLGKGSLFLSFAFMYRAATETDEGKAALYLTEAERWLSTAQTERNDLRSRDEILALHKKHLEEDIGIATDAFRRANPEVIAEYERLPEGRPIPPDHPGLLAYHALVRMKDTLNAPDECQRNIQDFTAWYSAFGKQPTAVPSTEKETDLNASPTPSEPRPEPGFKSRKRRRRRVRGS
jgi:hypothetical protein